MTSNQKIPDLFLSLPHACSYLPGKQSSMLFTNPGKFVTNEEYSLLIQHGFRRSGTLIYRPHCRACNACVPVRIPVQQFQPRRGQKRVWRRNSDLKVSIVEPRFEEDHFQLYRQYQRRRHPGSSMDQNEPSAYNEFLVASPVSTRFIEFREPGSKRLLAVAVVDLVGDGISAVYTYFNCDESHRGLGVYAILWQIDYAQSLGLPCLYLGYWIRDCGKMSYKQHYQPLEAYSGNRWLPFTAQSGN